MLFRSSVHSRLYGLGLWNHRWWTAALELALLALGIWTYQRTTRAKNPKGLYIFMSFILVLLLAYAGAVFGPPPSSVRKLAGVALLTWLAIPWAWWFDLHRETVR